MALPQRRASDPSVGLQALFAPRSVAVIGASRRERSIGRAILANLAGHGFAGSLYAVNPHADAIEGIACVASISQLVDRVDLAVVAVPAACVESVIAECAAAGVRAGIIVSSGFAEVSEDGVRAQERVLAIARAAGMRVVGPNCLGVIDTRSRLDASFAPTFPPAGNVAIASQSGALAIAVIDQATTRGLGIASLVSLGNRIDVSSNDLIEYWADDPGIAVIALYLESLGNSRRFLEIARRVSRQKPIIALKSGRSAVGMRAASSHSAALATSDVGVDALLASAGVTRVATMEELFDAVQLMSAQPSPCGPRVGIVSNAGGPAILLADACAAHGLSTPTLSAATRAALHEVLPPAAAVDNPVDMTAAAPPEHFAQSIEIVGRDPDVDALVAIYIPPYVTHPDEIAKAIAAGAATVPRDRPIAAVFMAPGEVPDALAHSDRGRIPSYLFPENVASALAKAVRYRRWRDRPVGERFTVPPSAAAQIRAIVDRQPDGWMRAADVVRLFEIAGIPFAATETCEPEANTVVLAAERIGYPVVLKAIAPTLVHKTEIGGVVSNVRSAGEVRAVVDDLAAKCRLAGLSLDGVLVQRQVRTGVETLAGMSRDPTLGPIVIAGLGGTAVELLRDVAVRIPPITDRDAEDMLGELRGVRLLDGFRGAALADRSAFVSAIQRVAALAELAPEVVELELNPLFVMPRGSGVLGVDARARIARASG